MRPSSPPLNFRVWWRLGGGSRKGAKDAKGVILDSRNCTYEGHKA